MKTGSITRTFSVNRVTNPVKNPQTTPKHNGKNSTKIHNHRQENLWKISIYISKAKANKPNGKTN